MDCEYLITCEFCLREWDGNAQCPCTMYISDDESPVKKKVKQKKYQHRLKNKSMGSNEIRSRLKTR